MFYVKIIIHTLLREHVQPLGTPPSPTTPLKTHCGSYSTWRGILAPRWRTPTRWSRLRACAVCTLLTLTHFTSTWDKSRGIRYFVVIRCHMLSRACSFQSSPKHTKCYSMIIHQNLSFVAVLTIFIILYLMSHFWEKTEDIVENNYDIFQSIGVAQYEYIFMISVKI